MNVSLRKSIALTFAAIITAISFSSAFGQAVKVTGEDALSDDLPSPQFAGAKNKRFSPLDWLEIEAKLKIEMKPEPKSMTCDKLVVRWYVAVKNREKPGTYLLFTKEIEYVNLPLNDEIFCSVYLSPASVRRITGSPRGGRVAVYKVGYEVLINGEKVYTTTKKGDADWWNTASENVSRSEAVPLLNKNETPFRDMWWDRYPEISVERR